MPGVAVAGTKATGIAGGWEKVSPSCRGSMAVSGHQAGKRGPSRSRRFDRPSGTSVNAPNPEDGRPGGAVRRVSQCQSAGSGQTMPTGRGAVNNYFQSNEFNGLGVPAMCKSGVLDR
jgi:hypothetical protein